MYFVLGLLSAGLVVLLVTPAIWRRAQRLTRLRVESSVPMTLAEIQAEKDQLRAEYAMASRRLEMNIERLRGQSAEQTVEVHHKREEIARLTTALATSADRIEGLEARAGGLAETLAATEARLAATTDELAGRERELATRALELAEAAAGTQRLEQLTAEQKLELVARNTEIANFTNQLAAARALEKTLSAERDLQAAALVEERASLAAERERANELESTVSRLASERDRAIAEIEQRNVEIKTLEGDLALKANVSARPHLSRRTSC
jgi:chromosome segregation ATPase